MVATPSGNRNRQAQASVSVKVDIEKHLRFAHCSRIVCNPAVNLDFCVKTRKFACRLTKLLGLQTQRSLAEQITPGRFWQARSSCIKRLHHDKKQGTSPQRSLSSQVRECERQDASRLEGIASHARAPFGEFVTRFLRKYVGTHPTKSFEEFLPGLYLQTVPLLARCLGR